MKRSDFDITLEILTILFKGETKISHIVLLSRSETGRVRTSLQNLVDSGLAVAIKQGAPRNRFYGWFYYPTLAAFPVVQACQKCQEAIGRK